MAFAPGELEWLLHFQSLRKLKINRAVYGSTKNLCYGWELEMKLYKQNPLLYIYGVSIC